MCCSIKTLHFAPMFQALGPVTYHLVQPRGQNIALSKEIFMEIGPAFVEHLQGLPAT